MVEDRNLEEKVVRALEQFSLVRTNKGEKKSISERLKSSFH